MRVSLPLHLTAEGRGSGLSLFSSCGVPPMSSKVVCASALVAARVSRFRARNRASRRLLPSCSFLVRAAESRAGTAQTILPVGKARTLPRSSFSQSAYLVITSRRRSTSVILR